MHRSSIPIPQLIHSIRGHRVMLDRDLASLYEVTTSALNQAVKRNQTRFPEDFMFELTRDEIQSISQTVTSSASLKFSKNVNAFTEQGVSMLSSVLNSERAVQMNIAIMRAFVRFREVLSQNKELADKLDELERKLLIHDKKFEVVFNAIRQLMTPPPEPPRKKIGFITDHD